MCIIYHTSKKKLFSTNFRKHEKTLDLLKAQAYNRSILNSRRALNVGANMKTIHFKDEKFNRFINKVILVALVSDDTEERENALCRHIEFIDDLYFNDMICEDDYLTGKSVLKRLQMNLK